jgi:hypothetical protein
MIKGKTPFTRCILNESKRNPNINQEHLDNPEQLATLCTQDDDNQNEKKHPNLCWPPLYMYIYIYIVNIEVIETDTATSGPV